RLLSGRAQIAFVLALRLGLLMTRCRPPKPQPARGRLRWCDRDHGALGPQEGSLRWTLRRHSRTSARCAVRSRGTPGFKIGILPTNAVTLKRLGIGKEESSQWQALPGCRTQNLRRGSLTIWLSRRLPVVDHHLARKSPLLTCPALKSLHAASERFEKKR